MQKEKNFTQNFDAKCEHSHGWTDGQMDGRTNGQKDETSYAGDIIKGITGDNWKIKTGRVVIFVCHTASENMTGIVIFLVGDTASQTIL